MMPNTAEEESPVCINPLSSAAGERSTSHPSGSPIPNDPAVAEKRLRSKPAVATGLPRKPTSEVLVVLARGTI